MSLRSLGTGRPYDSLNPLGALDSHWPTGTCGAGDSCRAYFPSGTFRSHGSAWSGISLGALSAGISLEARSSLRAGRALRSRHASLPRYTLRTGVPPHSRSSHGTAGPSGACISLGACRPRGTRTAAALLIPAPCSLPEILLIAIPHVSSPFCTYFVINYICLFDYLFISS